MKLKKQTIRRAALALNGVRNMGVMWKDVVTLSKLASLRIKLVDHCREFDEFVRDVEKNYINGVPNEEREGHPDIVKADEMFEEFFKAMDTFDWNYEFKEENLLKIDTDRGAGLTIEFLESLTPFCEGWKGEPEDEPVEKSELEKEAESEARAPAPEIKKSNSKRKKVPAATCLTLLILCLTLAGCLKESTTSVSLMDVFKISQTFKGSPASEATVMGYDAKTKSFGLVSWKSAQLVTGKEGVVELIPKDDVEALAWYRILNDNRIPVHIMGDPGKIKIVIPANRAKEAERLLKPPRPGDTT